MSRNPKFDFGRGICLIFEFFFFLNFLKSTYFLFFLKIDFFNFFKKYMIPMYFFGKFDFVEESSFSIYWTWLRLFVATLIAFEY